MNTYRYAEANPIWYTDPRGLSSFDDFGDWFDKEQYIQDTINTQGTQFLQDWAKFMGAWGDVSSTVLGTLACPKPSADTAKKACVLLGLCSAMGRGEEMDDVLRDLIARENLRRSSEIAQQITKPLTK